MEMEKMCFGRFGKLGPLARGCFAVKAFEAGDLIIDERPLEIDIVVSAHKSCLESRSFTRRTPGPSRRSLVKTI